MPCVWQQPCDEEDIDDRIGHLGMRLVLVDVVFLVFPQGLRLSILRPVRAGFPYEKMSFRTMVSSRLGPTETMAVFTPRLSSRYEM